MIAARRRLPYQRGAHENERKTDAGGIQEGIPRRASSAVHEDEREGTRQENEVQWVPGQELVSGKTINVKRVAGVDRLVGIDAERADGASQGAVRGGVDCLNGCADMCRQM